MCRCQSLGLCLVNYKFNDRLTKTYLIFSRLLVSESYTSSNSALTFPTWNIFKKMGDSKSYDRNSEYQKKEARQLIPGLLKNMNWKYDEGKKLQIVDFGCGSGYVTKEVLLPLLQEKCKEVSIHAIDISDKMIDCAVKNYSSKNIEYCVSDVLTNDWKLNHKVDKIFSFYVLHWIQDLEKLFKLFHEMLEPNGEIGFYFVPTTPVYKALGSMAKDPKWANNCPNMFSINLDFQQTDNPSKLITDVLNKSGFKIQTLLEEESAFVLPSMDSVVYAAMSLNQNMDQLPESLHQEFEDDLKRYLSTTVRMAPEESGGGVMGDMNKIIVNAVKI